MSSTPRFAKLLSRRIERAKTESQANILSKELDDVLKGIRCERISQLEALEAFLERAISELKVVVETEVRAAIKLGNAEQAPASPKTPRGHTFFRRVSVGDLPHLSQRNAPSPQRLGSKGSTFSRRGFFRYNFGGVNSDLPRTDSQLMSEQNENENREWRNRLHQSITKRLELAEKAKGPVRQLSTYFGFVARSQSTISGHDSGIIAGRRNWAHRIVYNSWFNMAVALVILVNAIVIGLQSESAIANAIESYRNSKCDSQSCEYEEPLWYQIAGVVLLGLMILEVATRLLADRFTFCFGFDWKWNAFDFLLLSFSFWEQLSDIQAFSHFRVLRGLRMIRVLRIIRVVRLFRELRLMVCSIAHSLWSLTWAVGLLLVGIYLVAVCFMYGVTAYIHNGDNHDVRTKLVDSYGSIGSIMWMLLLSVTGGIDWEQAVAPLRIVHPLYAPAFALYVCFVLMGVLNTFTSVFVEQAREFGKIDRDLVIQSELAQNDAFMREMRQIFEEVDSNGSGFITWSEFEQYIEDERVQAYFATQKLDTSEAYELFHVLSDGSGEGVELEEFILGCIRLKGQAKQGHLAILLREHRILNRKLRQFMRLAECHFAVRADTRTRLAI